MATREPKDLLTRLADRGEEAIQRLSDAPGADRLLGVAQSLRDRMDEMQRRVRGIDELETRRRSARGTTWNRAGVVPGCSPSSWIGSGSGASTVTAAPRRSSAFGCGRCFPR